MPPSSQLSSQLYGQIRVGRVSSVDETRHTAQVQFFEIDGFVSFDLQVLVTRPGDYSLPEADTPVLCLLLDGRLGVGYVLGCIYTESDEAPLDDASKRSIAGDDIRLGAHDADKKIALATKVKEELDKIKSELNKIVTTLGTGSTPVGGGTVTFATPYVVGYSPTEPAAENVSAK
jgi:phage baseplate assembly protein gpV